MALSIQSISTEYLPVLDNLMIEFFTPSINLERKEEIKLIVNNFAQQDNAWCYAIKFICESKSDYTKVYCFSVLHNFILKNWLSLTEQVKNELKDYIWTNLIKFHCEGNHSLFIQNKLCQMISTIIRLSYPNFWSDYFNDLANLSSRLETAKLAIRLLNITLEELLIPSDDLFEQRKNELNRLISNQVPLIVNVLSSIMRSISNKYLGALFVTPPASPIESGHYPAMLASLQPDEDIINTNNNKQFNLKSICLNVKSLLDNIDSDSLEVLELILKCNLTLFNWLSINDFYPLLNESMLELLFIFATFGCSNGHKETTIGILTMTCINELLTKNYVYNEFSSKFFLTLFEMVFKILLIIDNEINLENLDSEYLMKFMDSIRYFVTNQIVYKQQDHSFFFNFLEKLFCLTFKPKWNGQYQQLVEVWINLLDIFINNSPEPYILDVSDDSDDLESKLFVASNELFKQVLIKLQYRFNNVQLEELDTDDLNDYGQTELQIYFNCNVELLAKIALLIPNQTQKMVAGFFDELVKIYLNIDQLLGRSFSLDNKRIVTEYLSKEDANNLDYALKDFAVLIRVWTRLSEHFIGTNFNSSIQTVQTLLDQVLNCLTYSNRLKLFTFSCDKQVIVQDLNELHQSLLLFLKFYSSWITQYGNETQPDEQNRTNLNALLERICNECVCTIMIALDEQDQSQDPKQIKMHNELIIQSALLCLLTVSCSIKPKFLLNDPSIQTFFDKLYSSINRTTCSTCLLFNDQNRFANMLNKDSCINCKFINQLNTLPSDKCTTLKIENQQELVWIDTLSNILLLPWSRTLDNQDWERRSEKHKALVYSFYADLIKQFKDEPASFGQRIPVNSPFGSTLKRTLFLFTNLVNNHVESPTKTKQLLLFSLIEFLEFVLALLPANILNDDLGEYILSFLISVLEVFRSLIKLPFIDQIIKTLLDCISQNSLVDSKPEFKNSLVDKVFRIFIFIVEQPAASFKIILPNMLDVALNQMYQTVLHSNCNDLYSRFYDFLYKFVLNNSKFFFKTQLGHSIGGLNGSLNPSSTSGEQIANQQYFLRIFEIFGNSFITSNLHLFKQNLVALEALNFRQKLFHKQIFKENLLRHFISLFVQTMINNEHKILHDELTSIIYALASADYDLFKKICFFEFVSKLPKCSHTNYNQEYGQLFKSEAIEDGPTFNRQLKEYIASIYKSSSIL